MSRNKFAIFAWGVLGFTIAVILWGAFVRATGSGAGCGSHWPLCNGQVIPRAGHVETLIEYTHRITSALAGFLALVMLVWAFRIYPKGHIVRMGAAWSLFFMITEGMIGAGLVLFEWVAYNDSAARAISGIFHLVNTFLLVAFITLTAWWASGGRPIQLKNQGVITWLLGIGFVGMMLVGASGAVAAFGNMIYPSATLAEGVRADFSPTAHFLIRLRIWHPTIAILLGIYLIFASNMISAARPDPQTVWFARAIKVIFIIQLAAGGLNWLLLAPVWMQLLHLFLAEVVWITLVLLVATALAHEAPAVETTPLAPQAGD